MKVLLTLIRPAATALRKVVDKNSPKFQEIVSSVAKCGVLNPIPAQKRTDEETKEEYYEICDGLHRYTAATECGLEEIPIHLVELNEVDTLVAQVHANYAKVETKTSEFSKQLVRIMQKIPTCTEADLAQMTGFSLDFIRKRLKLNKIVDEAILALVDSGKISLQNAYALATLPAEEQQVYKEDAITEPPQAFLAAVKKRNKAIKEARKAGREQSDEFPGATPHLRSLKELKGIAEDKTAILQFVNDGMSPDEIVDTVINFVMSLDPISVDEQKAKWTAAQEHRKEQAERRAKDKATAKAEKAAEKAAEAQKEADKALAEATGEIAPEQASEEQASEG